MKTSRFITLGNRKGAQVSALVIGSQKANFPRQTNPRSCQFYSTIVAQRHANSLLPKRAPFVLCAFQTRLTTHPTSKWNRLPGVQASAVTDGVPCRHRAKATAPTAKNTFAPLTAEVADVLEGVQVAEARSQDEQDQPHHIEPLVNGKGQNGNGGKNNVRRSVWVVQTCPVCRATSANARSKRATRRRLYPRRASYLG